MSVFWGGFMIGTGVILILVSIGLWRIQKWTNKNKKE